MRSLESGEAVSGEQPPRDGSDSSSASSTTQPRSAHPDRPLSACELGESSLVAVTDSPKPHEQIPLEATSLTLVVSPLSLLPSPRRFSDDPLSLRRFGRPAQGCSLRLPKAMLLFPRDLGRCPGRPSPGALGLVLDDATSSEKQRRLVQLHPAHLSRGRTPSSSLVAAHRRSARRDLLALERLRRCAGHCPALGVQGCSLSRSQLGLERVERALWSPRSRAAAMSAPLLDGRTSAAVSVRPTRASPARSTPLDRTMHQHR